jgi:hypothetical protein
VCCLLNVSGLELEGPEADDVCVRNAVALERAPKHQICSRLAPYRC